jgi:hypothetical protein
VIGVLIGAKSERTSTTKAAWLCFLLGFASLLLDIVGIEVGLLANLGNTDRKFDYAMYFGAFVVAIFLPILSAGEAVLLERGIPPVCDAQCSWRAVRLPPISA